MKERPLESEEFESLLDAIFVLPPEQHTHLEKVFTGRESINVLLSEASGDFLDLVARVSELSQENWQRLNRILAPSVTPGFSKASMAIRSESMTTLKWHLEGKFFHQRVDADASCEDGTRLMHMAAKQRGAIRILLEYGADVEPRARDGKTPLMIAAWIARIQRTTDEMEELIINGARVNARAYHGTSPLHEACQLFPFMNPHDPPQGIAFLLAHGADPRLKNRYGDKPADLVQQRMQDLMDHPDQKDWVISEKIEKCEEALETLRIAEERMGLAGYRRSKNRLKASCYQV